MKRVWLYVGGVVAVAAFIVFCGAVLNWLGFNPGLGVFRLVQAQTQFWTHFWPWMLPFLVLVFVALMLSDDRPWWAFGVGALACVWLIVACYPVMVRPLHRVGHDVRHDTVNEALTVVADEGPTFDVRPPYAFQTTLLGRSIGDLNGVNVAGVWRFPIKGEQKTCGLIEPSRNGWKRPMSGVVCVTDDGKVERQLFRGQVPSPEVWLGELRLTGIVNDKIPGGTFEGRDLYGYIEDGKPYMVVPVRALTGWWKPVSVWAGALIYDTDGHARVVHQADGSIPGPIVGESLALDVLSALSDRAGFIDSKTAKVAYDTAAGDNASNLALDRADGGGMRLVTLLTPKGASQTPTALLEVDMTKIGRNEWPPAVLHRFPAQPPEARPLASDGEVVDRFTQTYGAALQMQQRGLRVMEITPTKPGHVRMMIGTPNNLLAAVDVDRASRQMCVSTPAGVQIRCDSGDGRPVGSNALDRLLEEGGGTPVATDGQATPMPVPSDASTLSGPQLLDLLARVAAEVQRRGLAS